MLRSVLVVTLCICAVVAGLSAPAAAVDAPRWVAVLYVDAQRSVGLRWLPVPGATGYKILRSMTSGSGYEEIGTTAQPQHFDTTVQPGETYFYVLQAVAGSEVSANAEERSVKIPGQKKAVTLPPEWVAVKADTTTEFGKTNYRVGLSWNSPKSGKAIAYNLYRSETSGSGYQSINSSPEATFVDTKVELGKTYYYVLTTLDDSFQESAYSPEQKVTIVEVKKDVVKKKKKITPVPLHTKAVFTLDNKLGLLSQPRDLAVAADGTIYITDAVAHKIVVFNKDNEFVARYGEPGRGEGLLDSPSGIAIINDNLYVTDQLTSYVHIFEQSGKFVKSVRPYRDPKLQQPELWGIAYDPTKKRIYLTDGKNHQVQVYDEDMNLQFVFGTKYDDAGKMIQPPEIKFPIAIEVSNDGSRLVVIDAEAHVTFYDDAGTKLQQIGERGASAGTFMYLNGITHDPKRDWFFVIDKTVNTAQIYDGEGNYKYQRADQEGKAGPGLSNPNGAEIVGNRFYVVENLAKQYSILELLWDKSPPPFAAE